MVWCFGSATYTPAFLRLQQLLCTQACWELLSTPAFFLFFFFFELGTFAGENTYQQFSTLKSYFHSRIEPMRSKTYGFLTTSLINLWPQNSAIANIPFGSRACITAWAVTQSIWVMCDDSETYFAFVLIFRIWFLSCFPKLTWETRWIWEYPLPTQRSTWRIVAWSPSCGTLLELNSCDIKEETSNSS